MRTRSKGPLAGFEWLKRGIGTGYRHPKALFGGAALLLVAGLLPTLILLPVQFHAQQAGAPANLSTLGWLMGGSMLVGLLLVPLYAGYLQVLDAAERGLPARALDIFKPYRQGEAWRLLGYGLAMILVYVALFAIINAAAGGGIPSWYVHTLTAQASHQPPPPLPVGIGSAMALSVVVVIFMMGFYAISLGQIALRQRSVSGAIGDGMIGALKNVLPLIVFAVCAILAEIVLLIAFLIAAAMLALIASLVGGWLVLVLLVPLYIALLLAIFTAMFGVMYYLWRDVCGDGIVTDMAPQIAA